MGEGNSLGAELRATEKLCKELCYGGLCRLCNELCVGGAGRGEREEGMGGEEVATSWRMDATFRL